MLTPLTLITLKRAHMIYDMTCLLESIVLSLLRRFVFLAIVHLYHLYCSGFIALEGTGTCNGDLPLIPWLTERILN